MATKEEIKAKILPRLIAAEFVPITSVVAQMTQDQKDLADHALRSRNAKLLGETILNAAKPLRSAAASQKADQMLANNSLDLNELEEILP